MCLYMLKHRVTEDVEVIGRELSCQVSGSMLNEGVFSPKQYKVPLFPNKLVQKGREKS